MRVHGITQPTGPAVITAEYIVTTEWTEKILPPPTFCLKIGPHKSLPLYNWLPTSAPPVPLVLLGLLPGYIRSSYIWAELWMFTAALYQSECRVRQPHSLTHTRTFTHSRTQTHTHTPVQRTPHYAPWWYPGSAARPAGADADASKCSTGITYKPVRHWKRRNLEGRETESSERTSVTAGYCSYRRCVKWLTRKKKSKTEIVQSLAESQARLSAGHSKNKTRLDFINLQVSLLTALGRRGETDRHSLPEIQDNTLWNTYKAGSAGIETPKQKGQITVRENTAGKMRMACDILLQR